MKNVLVRVRSVHTLSDGTEDLIENESAGSLEEAPGALILRYDEVLEDGDQIANELRLYSGRAVLKRSGAVSLSMVFAGGREGSGIYRTAYGDFIMNYTTQSLTSEIRSDGIRLALSYTFSLNGGPRADCRIGIDAVRL